MLAKRLYRSFRSDGFAMTSVMQFDELDGLPRLDTRRTPLSSLLTPHESVLVCETDEGFQALSNMLMSLNCTLVAGNVVSSQEPAPKLKAAIISDAIHDPIEVCLSLPPDLPKILIASNPTFAFRCSAARAGVEAIVKRPIDTDELSDWLEHFQSRDSPEPISVLLIDDHALTAALHAAVLKSAGMIVRTVTEPAEVLSVLDAMTPDLILMDIQMPGVDGIELTHIIRQSRAHLSIPIAFLSAESNEARKMAARKCGGDDFICKPVDLTQLAGKVRLRADRARATRSLIERDSLTGLLNHGRFKDRVAAELDRSRRTRSVLSLMMLDLDHFKIINDTYGHPTGDKVLRTLARALTGRLRSTDVIGRYGGEEFGVLLLDTTADMARNVADSLRQQFGEIGFDATPKSFSATFSAGIADSCDLESAELFAAADEALYAAKRKGRNRVELFAGPFETNDHSQLRRHRTA